LTERPEWSNRRNVDWPLFLEAYDTIAQRADGAISRADLDRVVVAGMAGSFKEGHTYYLPPRPSNRPRPSSRISIATPASV
jgi:hypothetical protein